MPVPAAASFALDETAVIATPAAGGSGIVVALFAQTSSSVVPVVVRSPGVEFGVQPAG